MKIDLRLGDCIEILKTLEDNSVDSIVTDPPYGLEFMGKEWDSFIKGGGTGWKAGQMADTQSLPDNNSFKQKGFGKLPVYRGMSDKQKMTFQEFSYNWAKECFRILKPGGHLLAFGGSRMYHRLACGIEDAGFEVRDQIMWIYGSGFPKSHNIGKAIDKIQGNEREVVGNKGSYRDIRNGSLDPQLTQDRDRIEVLETKGQSDWEGWGTALKPAHEPICMARKPLSEKSIAQNVLKHGTGGINIDGCRIGNETITTNGVGSNWQYKSRNGIEQEKQEPYEGRFPANIMFDEEAGKILDEQSDKASRFFYCPKVSKKERNAGLEDFEKKVNKFGNQKNGEDMGNKSVNDKFTTQPRANNHPTVKPIALMEYLIKLVTPKGGTVLEPFMGSGSTGIAAKNLGMSFIGIEKEEEYFEIAKQRINGN